jgi:hypothetical protein
MIAVPSPDYSYKSANKNPITSRSERGHAPYVAGRFIQNGRQPPSASVRKKSHTEHHENCFKRRNTMKRTLLLFTVLALFAATSSALYADPGELNFKVSGTVILLGNPFIEPFSVMPTATGKGPLGKLTGRGFYMYQKLGDKGEMFCNGGQLGMRLDSTGELLLLNAAPQPTGFMMPGLDGTFAWTQTWFGVVAGGTGRFEKATGDFSMTLDGSGAVPGFVHIYEGTIDIILD